MVNKDRLNQVTCIELLDDNASTFNKFKKNIKCGRPDEVVREMLSWKGKSNLDPFDYNTILDHACKLNERIVFDDGKYLLATSNDIIVLYKYESFDIKDRLGNNLEIGDKVLWVDPEKDARDLNRVWRIFDVQSEELVCIEDEFSEAEVLPNELISVKSLKL